MFSWLLFPLKNYYPCVGYHYIYVLMESLLCGPQGGQGTTCWSLISLSTMGSSDQTHVSGLFSKLSTCPAISQAPVVPFGSVWDPLPDSGMVSLKFRVCLPPQFLETPLQSHTEGYLLVQSNAVRLATLDLSLHTAHL